MGQHKILEIETSDFQALVIKMEAHQQNETDVLGERVTPAEAAVARAAVAGLSNREIAKQRDTSPRTVAAQLRSVYGKLGVSSRAELATVVD